MKQDLKHTVLIQALILFALSFGLYANTLNHQWASDDTMLILDNDYTHEGWEGIKKIWTSDSFEGYLGKGKNLLPGGRYRPLAHTLFNVQHTLSGGEANPKLGHWTNVLMFATAVLLLFAFLRKLFSKLEGQKRFFNLAFLSTILLAAHPLNTEAVANVKSLDLILSMMLSVGVLYYAVAYVDRKKPAFLIGIFLCYVLGILAKESTATLFLLTPVTLLFFRKEQLKGAIPVIITLTTGFIAYVGIRMMAIGLPQGGEIPPELLNNPFLEASTSEKYATIFYTWFVYLKLLVFPHPLTHDYYPYHIELTNWTNGSTLFAIVFFAGMSVLSAIHVFRLLRNKEQKANLFIYGFLFFFITFSVSSNLVFNIGAFMNERFVFFASTGFAIALAHALILLGQKVKNASIPAVLAVVLLIPYSAKTVIRNKVWKDDITLFTTDVLVSKNSAKCNVSAGGSYLNLAMEQSGSKKEQLLKNARHYVFEGLRIHPKNTQGWMLIGNIAFEQEDYEYTMLAYDNVLKLAPNHQTARSNYRTIAIHAWQKGKHDVSLKIFDRVPAENKNDSESRYYIADNYLKSNKIDTAITLLQSLIRDDSLYAEAYNKLGEIHGKYLQQIGLSEHYMLKAYELAPKNASILENLGVLKGMKGEFEQSVLFFEEALKYSTKKKQLYSNLSLSYSQMGNTGLAQEYQQKAQTSKE